MPSESKLNLNFLKLVALASMTLDHSTKILFHSYDNFGTQLGRIAMPLFVFLISYNFLFHSQNPKKYLIRIFIFSILSQLPFYLAFDQSVLLNIFFTLGILGLILKTSTALIQKSSWYYYAVIVVVVGILLIVRYLEIPIYFEYGLAGLILGLSITAFLIHRTIDFALYILLTTYYLNNSLVSFVALLGYLPLIFFLASRIPNQFEFMRRWKYLFYSYYPVHLILLIFIRYLLEHPF